MAEEMFKFLDPTISANSFKEFETLWEQIEKYFENEDFPSSPQRTTVTITPIDASALNQDKKLISLEPSTFVVPPSSALQYSPPADENRPPATVDEETGERSFEIVEDSILTSFRRKHPGKYSALEKKMRQPFKENVKEQLNILRNLHKRMVVDMQQSSIIINNLEDKFECSAGPARKRVKFFLYRWRSYGDEFVGKEL